MEREFGPCTCAVEDIGDRCGPSCHMGLGTEEEPCKCGHDACAATTGEG